ncbi:MAG: cytochrome P450, partial [Clostridiales bacterium]|nr:cytochrome P450 [Clostridiales bacterium]
LGFLKDGYLFISNRMNQLDTNIFSARFLGKKIIFLRGKEAAELFYNESFFQRKGVAPMRVQKTLFGQKAIQGLDGKQHKERKSMFMSLLTSDSIDELATKCYRMLDRYADKWEQRPSINLYRESQKILFESVCQWVEIPYQKVKVNEYAQKLGLMIYGFGRVGKMYREGKNARKEIEAWVRDCVVAVRNGSLVVSSESPLYCMSMYKEEGNEVPAQIAAVELINVIRPVVAIATFVVFEALAMKDYPECLERLRNCDSEYTEMFCQEVRRFYPFGPFIGAKAKFDFAWNGYYIKKNSLVVLDLYGTNHDPNLWNKPNRFHPVRFAMREECLYDLIPQGGGKIKTGHRCAGDVLTVKIMEVFADYLANQIHYEVPKQNLGYSLRKFPTLPESGFVMRKIRKSIR